MNNVASLAFSFLENSLSSLSLVEMALNFSLTSAKLGFVYDQVIRKDAKYLNSGKTKFDISF